MRRVKSSRLVPCLHSSLPEVLGNGWTPGDHDDEDDDDEIELDWIGSLRDMPCFILIIRSRIFRWQKLTFRNLKGRLEGIPSAVAGHTISVLDARTISKSSYRFYAYIC